MGQTLFSDSAWASKDTFIFTEDGVFKCTSILFALISATYLYGQYTVQEGNASIFRPQTPANAISDIIKAHAASLYSIAEDFDQTKHSFQAFN